jgi:uncharacterized protein
MISPDREQSLSTQLTQFKTETSTEIAVVTIPNLGGDSIENYANELFREWGIGTKENNNGVLLLVSKEDRQMRIEVGYGLEGALPDATASSIIRNDITPLFKQNEYDAGIQTGVDKIIQATRGEYLSESKEENNSLVSKASSNQGGDPISLGLKIGFSLFFALFYCFYFIFLKKTPHIFGKLFISIFLIPYIAGFYLLIINDSRLGFLLMFLGANPGIFIFIFIFSFITKILGKERAKKYFGTSLNNVFSNGPSNSGSSSSSSSGWSSGSSSSSSGSSSSSSGFFSGGSSGGGGALGSW